MQSYRTLRQVQNVQPSDSHMMKVKATWLVVGQTVSTSSHCSVTQPSAPIMRGKTSNHQRELALSVVSSRVGCERAKCRRRSSSPSVTSRQVNSDKPKLKCFACVRRRPSIVLDMCRSTCSNHLIRPPCMEPEMCCPAPCEQSYIARLVTWYRG